MKSDHRRELKSNELAEWLANFPTWAKENYKTIIYVSVVAIIVAVVFVYKRYEKNVVVVRNQVNFTNLIKQIDTEKTRVLQAQSQGFDLSANLLKPANSLKAAAEKEEKNDTMAALGLIKSAQLLRTELHYRLGNVNSQQITTQINQAKASYNKAIEKAKDNPVLLAMAKFGLGLCEEELGNFAEAKALYAEVAENEEYKNTVASVQASLRLKTIDDYKQNIVFKPAPVQVPVYQPEIELAPMPEINIPVQPAP